MRTLFPRKLSAVLTVGIAVPALALASCSSDDDSSSDQDTTAEDTGSDSSSGTSDSYDDTSGDSAASGSVDDLPDAPEGFDLTDPGTRLDIGEAAYVVTQQGEYEGETYPVQYWKVTAQAPTEKAKDSIPLDEGEDTADIDHFMCMNYDLEFLGQSPASAADDYTLVTEPDMGAVDDNGNGANYILMGGSEECDIHETDALPDDAADLQTGKTYKGAVLSWVAIGDQGITPTGLSFTYDVGSAGLEDTDDIYWN